MAQGDFVAKLNFMCTDIELIEDFLIYMLVKDEQKFAKKNKIWINLFFEESDRGISREEKYMISR